MWNKTLFLLVLAIGLAAGSGQASAVPNILVIHSYNPDLSWTSDIHRGITEALAQSSGAYSLSTEYLDAKRYPQQDLLDMQSELIATHVRSNTFNAVIVSDDAAYNFVYTTSSSPHSFNFSVFCVFFLIFFVVIHSFTS